MNTQINVRFPEKLLASAKDYADRHGFSSLQEFIKEAVRERVDDELTEEEVSLARRLLKAKDDRRFWGTEEELFKKLKRRK